MPNNNRGRDAGGRNLSIQYFCNIQPKKYKIKYIKYLKRLLKLSNNYSINIIINNNKV